MKTCLRLLWTYLLSGAVIILKKSGNVCSFLSFVGSFVRGLGLANSHRRPLPNRSRRETPPPSRQSPKRKRTNTASGIDSVDSVDRDDDNERPGSQERPPQQHAQMGDNGPNDGELPSKKPKTPRNATAVAAAVVTTRNDEGGTFCCPQRDSRVNAPEVAGDAP